MIDLPDLKAALNIPADMADHDDYLQELEEVAVAYVGRVTGRYLGAVDDEAEFVVPGDGIVSLFLPQRVSEVTAVSERPYPGGVETVIATDDADGWELRLASGETHGARLVRKGGYIWHRGYEYVVTATIGYNAGTEPAEDRGDVVALVAFWFEERLPAVTGTVAQKVPLHVAERLAARRKVRA